MDPLTTLVTALVMGASTALKETAETAVKDGYAALKGLLAERFGGVDVGQIEKKPESDGRRTTLAEDLEETGAVGDAELVAKAEALIAAIEQSPLAAEIVGIDLQGVKARNITLRDIVSSGSGIIAKDVMAEGDFTAEGVRAGQDPGAGGKA